MNVLEKLDRARELLVPVLIHAIQNVRLRDEHFTLKIDFKQKSVLYILYNDYHEYSYQLLISHQALKSIRFDNFDDRWDVPTRPNHVHLKNKSVMESPMNGDPTHDIPLLIKALQQEFGV
jgi:hypothetical protein